MSLNQRAVAFVSLLCLLPSPSIEAQPIVERVDVARLLLDVHVVDESGRPVSGLGPIDFEVTIDGKSVRPERAEWHGVAGSTASGQPVSPGRLIVFFVQRTQNSNVSRQERSVIGLSRALRLIDPILANLNPRDRIAIVSFDMHLQVWSDFTNDVSLVRAILRTQVLTSRPTAPGSGGPVSLLTREFRERAESAYTMERALNALGDALQHLSGSKTVIVLGHGFGRPDAFQRSIEESALLPGLLDDGYEDTLASLVKARAALFAIDVTPADRHSLEVGLQALTRDTGGVFTRAYPFPEIAIATIAETLGGYYTLSVERPTVPQGAHRIRVRTHEQSLTVHAPSIYVD